MHRALAIAEQIFEPRVIVLDLVPASLDALRRGQKDDGTGGGLYLYGQRRKADFRRRAQGAGRNGAGGRHDRRYIGCKAALIFSAIANGIDVGIAGRSEEHTSELQSLMRISYAVFCLKKNN